MKRYAKIYKVIALWNSYNSLEGSDFTRDEDVQKAMSWCLDEITRLGVDVNELPPNMNDLISYLKALK